MQRVMDMARIEGRLVCVMGIAWTPPSMAASGHPCDNVTHVSVNRCVRAGLLRPTTWPAEWAEWSSRITGCVEVTK
jgi:hypothetical protein